MSTLTIKRFDRRTPLRVTLSEDGTAVNLTDLTVFLVLGTQYRMIFRRACTFEDAAAGKVRYDWQAGDTDLGGTYNAEFEVTDPLALKKDTYPSADTIQILIVNNLATS